MIKHYLTDEVGVILAIFNDSPDSVSLAWKQGKDLANSFRDSEIYLHSGTFVDGTKLEVGMGSSMTGPITRIEADKPFSGYSTSRCVTSCHTGNEGNQ